MINFFYLEPEMESEPGPIIFFYGSVANYNLTGSATLVIYLRG